MMIKRTAARTPRGAVRASKPTRLIGTWFADFIKASGQMHRTERPET
jgi:hypothetical protein